MSNGQSNTETRRGFLGRAPERAAAVAALFSTFGLLEAACGEKPSSTPKPWESMTNPEKTQILNQQIEKSVASLATRVNRAAHQYPEQSFISNGNANDDPVSTIQNDTFRRPASTTIPNASNGEYYAQVVAEKFDTTGNPDPNTILAIEAHSTVLAARPEEPAGRQLTYSARIYKFGDNWGIDLAEPIHENELGVTLTSLNTSAPESLSPSFVDAITAQFNTVLNYATQPTPVPVGALPPPMK